MGIYFLLVTKSDILYYLLTKKNNYIDKDFTVLTNLDLNKYELELLNYPLVQRINCSSFFNIIFNSEILLLSDKRSLFYHIIYYFSVTKKVILFPDGLSDVIDNYGVIPVISPLLSQPKKNVFGFLNLLGSVLPHKKQINVISLDDLRLFFESRSNSYSKSNTSINIFIGQPLSELGVLSEKDELLILNKVISRVGKIQYYLHPKESVNKFRDFSADLELIEYSVPCELRILNNEYPFSIFTFYSTTILNLKDILREDIELISFDILNFIDKKNLFYNEVRNSYNILKSNSIEVFKI